MAVFLKPSIIFQNCHDGTFHNNLTSTNNFLLSSKNEGVHLPSVVGLGGEGDGAENAGGKTNVTGDLVEYYLGGLFSWLRMQNINKNELTCLTRPDKL